MTGESAKILGGLRCQERCGFCREVRHAGKVPEKTTEELRAEIRELRSRGATRLDMLGGELTLRRDLPELVALARSVGFTDVMLTTNGLRLADERVSRALIGAGLTELRLSIHGHRPELHDAITEVPGSLAKLVRGLLVLRRLGFSAIGSNTTVERRNYRWLGEIVDFVGRLGIRRANLIYVGAAGREDHEAYVPRVSDAAPHLLRALEPRPGVEVRALNLPVPCPFWDRADRIDDFRAREGEYLRASQRAAYREIMEEKGAGVPTVKVDECAGCAASGRCPGVSAEYLRWFGGSEVRAVARA